MTLYYATLCLLQTLSYLFLIFVALIVIGRICFEPIKAVCKCTTKLHGKIALVTGGNSGIGLETAIDLASRGARVIIACRNEIKAREAIEKIARTAGNTNIEFRYLDLFKPSCIRDFANNFNEHFDRLDILVNNAGCIGFPPELAENGVERTMQVNHIGPFLLTNLLMDKLEASTASRIVIVSSKLHVCAKLNVTDLAGVRTFTHFLRYVNSKLCNVLWAKALATRLSEGVTVNSVHPGLVRTDIFKNFGYLSRIVDIIIKVLFKTPQEGAQTVIHLCVSPELEGSTGGYYAECKLQSYYRLALDEDLEQKVWDESMRLAEK